MYLHAIRTLLPIEGTFEISSTAQANGSIYLCSFYSQVTKLKQFETLGTGMSLRMRLQAHTIIPMFTYVA